VMLRNGEASAREFKEQEDDTHGHARMTPMRILSMTCMVWSSGASAVKKPRIG
jgi:hypothetical protein